MKVTGTKPRARPIAELLDPDAWVTAGQATRHVVLLLGATHHRAVRKTAAVTGPHAWKRQRAEANPYRHAHDDTITDRAVLLACGGNHVRAQLLARALYVYAVGVGSGDEVADESRAPIMLSLVPLMRTTQATIRQLRYQLRQLRERGHVRTYDAAVDAFGRYRVTLDVSLVARDLVACRYLLDALDMRLRKLDTNRARAVETEAVMRCEVREQPGYGVLGFVPQSV